MGKKGLSDKVRNKQKNKEKAKSNPFEVKINKVKQTVLNRKLQKWEKGVPGISRSKAIKKRKDTLLRELHHMKKSNYLLDKRFGENDSNLTADEKMVQRFALEKKNRSKGNLFSLNDEEEVLTHYGQSLSENLKDGVGADSDDEDGQQLPAGQFQFGGFTQEDGYLTWKDKMKEVIADSKKQKYEKQAEKEQTLEATKDLDTDWKSLGTTYVAERSDPKKKLNDYVKLFNTLVLEQKSGGASNRTKTADEEAKDEIEKLKKLEAERVKRMTGHLSADALDDGFQLDENIEDEKNDENDSETADDGGESGDNENDNSGEDEDDSNESDDNFFDVEDDEESEEDEKQEEETLDVMEKTTTKRETKTESTDLPYLFEAPGSFQELKSLLHGHTASEQKTIISRLRKCYHPSLAEGNKDKLEKIHLFVLEYYGFLALEFPLDRKLMENLCVALWEMTQTFPLATASAMQDVILSKQKHFSAVAEKRGGRGLMPDLDTLLYLQLIECLFPTSDFRHPVTTPAINFISQILAESSIKSLKDVVAGLFLCSLATKFTSLSKRYIPETVTFIHGLLVSATPTHDKASQLFAPFKTNRKVVSLLEVKEKCTQELADWSLSELLSVETEQLDNDKFKCEAVNRCLDILEVLQDQLNDLPSFEEIFAPFKIPLSKIPPQLYSSEIREKINRLKALKVNTKTVMKHKEKKPQPLKLFEPQIEEVWTGKKKGGANREVNDQQRLKHKVKREMKAAIREIQKDNQVLAQHKLELTMAKDAERKRKTKDLLNSLANQEGEVRAIKRNKTK